MPVISWLQKNDIFLFTDCVTSVGLAELYWPRAHTDADAWYTILVVIDLGTGLHEGGDFGFCTLGTILKACHGDVFFFNPCYVHGCTWMYGTCA